MVRLMRPVHVSSLLSSTTHSLPLLPLLQKQSSLSKKWLNPCGSVLASYHMENDAHDAIEEGRRLLLDILPLFTSNPDRVESTKGACFQAYYCLICIEAKILEDLLKDSNTRHPQYADILGKILKLFESLVKPGILFPSKSFLVCGSL